MVAIQMVDQLLLTVATHLEFVCCGTLLFLISPIYIFVTDSVQWY